MNDNHQYISEAKALTKAFDDEKEPERLREAYLALENVDIYQEPKQKMRNLLRLECLSAWLNMINTMDGSLDKDFDPNAPVEMQVQPPPTSDGTKFPPGTDPARIDDPEAREKYEKAIKVNQEKLANYRTQTYLNRIKDDIVLSAKTFILTTYTPVPSDQLELKTAIEKILEDPARKEDFMGLVKTEDEKK